MPIYHKAPPSIVGNHTTAEIDNHTSEAAKVKRTREHAYFNSYDFDAIEVLPYDDEDEEEEGGEGGKPKQSNNNTCLAKTTTTAPTATSAISQKQLKSKTHAQQHISQTRQHLQQHQQQPAKFPYPQQQPLAALKHSKTSSNHSLGAGHGNHNSSNSDNFIVDNLPHRNGGGVSGSGNIGKAGPKYNSYLQRFGVALFGGGGIVVGGGAVNVINNTNKSSAASSLHQPSSSSSSTTTSSSLAQDDNKHLKVISSDLSTRATTPSSITTTTSSSASASQSAASSTAVAESLNGNIAHRDVVAGGKCDVVSKVVNDVTNGVASVTAATSAAAVGAIAASAAAADGNFLLPRAMLKYQSTLNGSSGNHLATAAATTTTSMPMAAATSNSTAAAAITTNTGSSLATDGFPTASATANSSHNPASRLKKHSTASSSLSSLGSEEIVEIHHHADIDADGSKVRKDSKVLPKLVGGKTPGRAASHQSHYSTDKSASSGYYSSNVCSTYSLEEHIYSEPTIEVKEKPLGLKESINAGSVIASGSGSSNNPGNAAHKPVEEALQHATLAAGETCSGSVMRTLDYNRRYRYTDHNEGCVVDQTLPAKRASKDFNENLRILESSIENLDRHLKSFPGAIPTQDAIVAYAQNPYQAEKLRSYAHLPTIREGYDATAKRVWSEDPVTDDSLMDIDLDSFLLDEGQGKGKKRCRLPPAKGIDNPSFLTEELEENHYKCAKYINSCPEDAYRVESDIIAPTRSSMSEKSVAVSVDLYPKRYEDQIHFQNTRELLEDVRDKIRLLNLSQDPTQELAVSSQAEQHLALEEHIPKELNTMISTLKRELELYLQRMNQHSELEIRQLCTGLVKNHNIVKMKNAFERRRSITDVSAEHLTSYEALQGEMRALGGVPISIRQQLTTIKCSSDPNFKMKRKSLTEVFPISECYIETLALGPENGALPLPHLPSGGGGVGGSQLQRNLNFHQPNIQQLETKTSDNFDKAKNNAASGVGGGGGSSSGQASGSPSGNDSSESNDKDSILDWHRKKPSIWEMYYGTNRIQQSLLGGNGKKNGLMVTTTTSTPSPMCYPSSRPESDFTLDLPRAEQLRIKMEKEKKFRQRCRVITTFLSLVFFLLTVMVVSLVLTRGKRMFGSMI